MLDTNAALLALRARARSLVAVTTGAVSLSATTTGYARAAGSFLTDGFEPGMEITPAGFTTNTVAVITGVSALTLTTAARTAEASASGRTISVKLPVLRAWENIALTDSLTGAQYTLDSPPPGRPYLTEEFAYGAHGLIGYPADGSDNSETGLYVLTWYGLENYGSGAIRKPIDALRRLFAPGTTFTVGGALVRMPITRGPNPGQPVRTGGGWTAMQLQIPWWSRSTNTVTA